MQHFGEVRREGGFGGCGDKTALLKIEEGLTVTIIIHGFDTQIACHSKQKLYRYMPRPAILLVDKKATLTENLE